MTEPNAPMIIDVAVPLPLDSTFHYAVPRALASRITTGVRVLVPFGRRKVTGYVLGPVGASAEELKEVIDVLDPEPLFTKKELEFFRWTASYYLYPLGEVLKAALPAGINVTSRLRAGKDVDGAHITQEVMTGGRRVKTELYYKPVPEAEEATVRGKGEEVLAFLRNTGEASARLLRRRFGACSPQLARLRELGAIVVEQREVYRDPFREEVFEQDAPLVLNASQSAAFDRISGAMNGRAFTPFLLFGVTGSGKTEVYLQTIAHCVGMGKTALLLVPEIALTPQLVRRFKRRFSCGIAVLHSALSDGERYDEWRRIRRGEVSVVIGARSAIFAPLERIGVIVVDEEHEASYKQSEGFRYNARDLALVRGKMERACVILGSATPLVTTFHAVREGKLACLALPERVRNLPMPETELVDMRGQRGESFSPRLLAALADNLAGGGQALLFLNRRGFATFLVCRDCGHVFRCPNCSVTLTYHRHRERHFCHYCDYSVPAPSLCPACSSPDVGLLGRGTERIEDEVRELFPQARAARMDSDTTTGKGAHGRIIREVEAGTINILIGTQMIAKGHDFPGVTLVGVVSADASLNLPDFRSAERAFQLMTQVMGRAGRGDQPGKVLIQTLAPDHYAIIHAVRHDFAGFFTEELAFRREAGYPPFAHLAALTFSGTSAQAVQKGAEEGGRFLREVKRELRARVEILGPASAPLGKIRGRYRWQLLLKSAGRGDLHRLLAVFRGRFTAPAAVRLNIDVDPVDML